MFVSGMLFACARLCVCQSKSKLRIPAVSTYAIPFLAVVFPIDFNFEGVAAKHYNVPADSTHADSSLCRTASWPRKSDIGIYTEFSVRVEKENVDSTVALVAENNDRGSGPVQLSDGQGFWRQVRGSYEVASGFQVLQACTHSIPDLMPTPT